MKVGIAAAAAVCFVIVALAACARLPQASGNIYVEDSEDAIRTVLDFAASQEFRTQVLGANPRADSPGVTIELKRYPNTSVVCVSARAPEIAKAMSVAESMVNALTKRYPGPGSPAVKILDNVEVRRTMPPRHNEEPEMIPPAGRRVAP